VRVVSYLEITQVSNSFNAPINCTSTGYDWRQFEADASAADFPHHASARCTMKLISRFLNDDGGATAIEYALIASLVAVAIVTALTVLGGQLTNTFGEVANNLK
jgi:pilus assembly protein Flp/PilA